MVSTDDLFGGSVGGGSASPFGPKAAKQIFNAMLNPQFYQAWAALSDAGMDPWDEMGQFVLSGKGAKKEAKGQPGYIPLGKGKFLNVGELSAKLPEYKAQAQEANMKAAQATYDKLLETPAYATVAAQSKGEFADDYMNSVNKHFGSMAAGALGGLADSGFIGSAQKAASAILPASEAKSQYLTEAQKAAQSYLQGLAGFGGTPGQSAFALSGLSAPGAYYNPMFSAAQMNQQNQQFNSQMDFNQAQFKSGLANQWFDKAMAAAGSFGGMGGGGGGGGGGPSGWHGPSPWGY
jgi:hypothetical protein